MHRELHEINAGFLQDDVELRATINDRLESYAVDPNHYPNHYDIRELPYNQVIDLIHSLVDTSRIALHGCDSDAPYAELDPAFSNPATKVPSIFATTDARVALMNAVFRTHGPLVDRIRSERDEGNRFAAAMYVHGQTKIFEAPPGIADALREALASPEASDQFNEIFTDGMVYIAAGRFFMRDDPSLDANGERRGGADFTDHEVNSPTIVSPLATVHVSRHLARNLFRMNGDEKDTVHTYSEEEMAARRERRRRVMAVKKRMGEAAVGLDSGQ